MTERAYHVVLEPDRDGGYVVEALANVKEAMALTIDDMLAHGEVIPDPA